MAEVSNEYVNYQNMISLVTTALSDMERLCEQMKMEENRQEIERIQKKLSGHIFSVGIMGEFKRGKSTVINSLLEKEIMPADILPCSATMNRVTYDLHPHVQLQMRDGTTKDIPVEELASYVTKLNAENESRAAEVDEAIVYYPCRFCKNGVDIVDTPGLNDDERMNKISEEVIPKLDAVIMVLTPDNPFSMSEAEFVRNKLMASDLSRLIFVVNKIDTIRRVADRKRVVDGIREKIQKSVMEKMANVYGEESEEYAEAVQKMGKIRIFPLSALDALDGKIEGDQELIEKSGTLEFEAALTKMLTEERGVLELSMALNAIARVAVEVNKTVNIRKEALALSAQEFEESQRKALAEINHLREDKRQEKKRLRESARNTKAKLKPDISEFYPALENVVLEKMEIWMDAVDPRRLESDAGLKAVAEELQHVIDKECEDQITLISEQIIARLDQQIGKDLVKASAFIDNISKDLNLMNSTLFTKKSGFDESLLISAGLESFVLFGLGGALEGFRTSGIKGALVGGGLGAGASIMAVALAAELAILNLPVAMVCGLVGALAGRFGVKSIFKKEIGKKKRQEMKEKASESIHSAIVDLQGHHSLEDWCDQLVQKRFDELIARMEDETEKLLKATEGNIDEIKRDITENEMQRKQISDRLDKVLQEIKKITEEDLAPVSARVRTAIETA